ncbi:MAG: hypothetical protein ACRC7O_01875 [Fimbriiglobus sp.]
MALERRNGGVYYYTSRRVGERVVKVYRGSGRVVELAAEDDAAGRELRHLERSAREREAHRWQAESVALRNWVDAVDAVVAAALERSGWHAVRRQWRRKREITVANLHSVAEFAPKPQTWPQNEQGEAYIASPCESPLHDVHVYSGAGGI